MGWAKERGANRLGLGKFFRRALNFCVLLFLLPLSFTSTVERRAGNLRKTAIAFIYLSRVSFVDHLFAFATVYDMIFWGGHVWEGLFLFFQAHKHTHTRISFVSIFVFTHRLLRDDPFAACSIHHHAGKQLVCLVLCIG
jgi:hypothetical protein